MIPNDSGEREVCWCGKPSGHKVGTVRAPFRDCTCYVVNGKITPDSRARCPRHVPRVPLPLPLAQRILAALEGAKAYASEARIEELRALAMEIDVGAARRRTAEGDGEVTRLIAMAALALLVGCESRRDLGSCIGALDEPDPALRYETSTRNVVVGAIFIETLVVPAVVVATEWKCPVAMREHP